MKKLIVLTLTLVLTVSVISSCSADNAETTLPEEETTAVSAENTPEINSASAGIGSENTDLEESTQNTDEDTSDEGIFYVG